MEIITIADIPSAGTGLGSFSSFTVGLINALSTFKGTARHELLQRLEAGVAFDNPAPQTRLSGL